MPPPVRAVEIPKKKGGSRMLGVPTVADRVAQTVAYLYLEPEVEPLFHRDSYGYRPGRSGLDAVAIAGVLDRFYAVAGRVVTERGGRVVKYLGDGCLVVFPPERAAVAPADLDLAGAPARLFAVHANGTAT